MNGLAVLIPPGVDEPERDMDVSVAGPPGRLAPSSAVATWDYAVSLSWVPGRPQDWTRVLEAIDRLGANPFDGTSRAWSQDVKVEGYPPPWAGSRWLEATVLPHLGVTVIVLVGLNHTAVAVVAGRVDELPTEVRLLPAVPRPL